MDGNPETREIAVDVVDVAVGSKWALRGHLYTWTISS